MKRRKINGRKRERTVKRHISEKEEKNDRDKIKIGKKKNERGKEQ